MSNHAYGGNPGISVQPYSPQLARRDLTPGELGAIAAGKARWLPRIFQSYGTPIPQMMSSPGKGAIMGGAGGALLGGTLGAGMSGSDPMAAGVGALGGGGLGAILMYLRRKAHNEGLEELMRRLPENPQKRDLLADSAYQADLNRASQRANAARYPDLPIGAYDALLNQLQQPRVKQSAAAALGQKAAMMGMEGGLNAGGTGSNMPAIPTTTPQSFTGSIADGLQFMNKMGEIPPPPAAATSPRPAASGSYPEFDPALLKMRLKRMPPGTKFNKYRDMLWPRYGPLHSLEAIQ